MFSFIKPYLLECAGYFNVANGRKFLLALFPDVSTIVALEILSYYLNCANKKTPGRPFVNRIK